MKIYLNRANENWIVDRFRNEWYKLNSDISTNYLRNSDIVWIISPWTWQTLSKKHLINKKVVATIHHLDLANWKSYEKETFYDLDKYVDYYHTISNKSLTTLQQVTDKKIINIPFWVNDQIFFEIKDKKKLRKNYNFQTTDYLIGSFQRDTEGSDRTKPKLIKGPDIFVETVKKLSITNKRIKVVLAGKRREYIINELLKHKIRFKYLGNVSYKKLNELYNILDLYIVSSRIEGGPQAVVECGLTKTPIISTDVGIASQILHEDSIFSDSNLNPIPNIEYAYKKSIKLKIPEGMKEFRFFFRNI